MPRQIQDVELPPARPEVGCARHHGKCAFTGREPDRCRICHDSRHPTAEHGQPSPSRATCAGCGEVFTGVSAFDRHQQPAGVCRDPEARGLILIEHGDWMMWGWPGSRPEEASE